MKKIIYTVVILFAAGILVISNEYAYAKKDGAPSSSAGGPGDESTCAKVGCHAGTAQFRDGFVTTNIPEEGYTEGETYTITVAVSSESRNTFGFQLTPQDASGNKKGNLEIIDSERTKITGLGKYVTHTLSSLEGTDGFNEWTFNWNATGASGDFKFYVAVNVANGNDSATGDSIYISSVDVVENATPVGLSEEQSLVSGLLLLNNPVGNELMLNAQLLQPDMHIMIYDLHGKLISAQLVSETVVAVNNLKPGMYILQAIGRGTKQSTRFIKS
jgi:hypothetical protein